MAIGLSGCYYDSGWSPAPPSGWDDTFYDSRLNGYWQLVQINGGAVGPYDTNYLFFGGAGRGRYYYFDRGVKYWEETAYWCQYSNTGQTDYQINLQYENTWQPTTMNYWFTDRGYTLWMQWRNSMGLQTYVYRAIDYAPW